MQNIETYPIDLIDNTCRSCVFFESSNVVNGTGSYMGCSINNPCWEIFMNTQKLCQKYSRAEFVRCSSDGHYRTCINIQK